ncbi:diphthine-ammonia ligase [Nematocida sp. LUAm3]|nr:diphthine-ammonia ligase [Nematocida sp. LUAm3]KAI5173917.1 diphthine-ammonia ligase [Nematocida sp. LUAm2]KAI5177338.1 diphthine-ammonia ligase [Nematocida sp. LUAm1]
MRFIGLISGGKDSIYNISRCMEDGHVLVGNLNLKSPGEKDSYMYQYVGNNLVSGISECLGVPLLQMETSGESKNKDKEYKETEEDEVEDLYLALKEMMKKYSFEGVSVGAIKSEYQNNRVINVCKRLNLSVLSYLWNRNQRELLEEMVEYQMKSIIIRAGEYPLSSLVGKDISHVLSVYSDYIKTQIDAYPTLTEEDFNICGEGGEYETITLDAPIFTKKIIIDKQEIHKLENETYYLFVKEYHLENK